MNEENKVVENQDRLALKQCRKERKLLKKILKREERERENDKRKLELKLGPKDQHITIISKDVADSINKPTEICIYSSNSNLNINSINDNFPVLDNVTKPKQKNVKIMTDLPTSIKTTNKQNLSINQIKTSTLTIDLMEILTKPKSVVTQKSASKEIQKYDGNTLDSSQPKRHKGKQREVPKRKQPTKLKSQIIAEMKECDNTNSTNVNFCWNIITDDLNTAVKEFITSIVRFQENLYKRDPIKGTARRRYITGFREVKKFLLVKKIKFLIFAPNIKNAVKDGVLDTIVHELISLAVENNVPYVFALSRRKLGQITLKNIPISCVGIFYYDGAEKIVNIIVKLLENSLKTNEINKPQKEHESVNGIIHILTNSSAETNQI